MPWGRPTPSERSPSVPMHRNPSARGGNLCARACAASAGRPKNSKDFASNSQSPSDPPLLASRDSRLAMALFIEPAEDLGAAPPDAPASPDAPVAFANTLAASPNALAEFALGAADVCGLCCHWRTFEPVVHAERRSDDENRRQRSLPRERRQRREARQSAQSRQHKHERGQRRQGTGQEPSGLTAKRVISPSAAIAQGSTHRQLPEPGQSVGAGGDELLVLGQIGQAEHGVGRRLDGAIGRAVGLPEPDRAGLISAGEPGTVAAPGRPTRPRQRGRSGP